MKTHPNKIKVTLLALLYFISFALCAFSLAHCKPEVQEPITQQETAKSVDNNWFLNFKTTVVLDSDTLAFNLQDLPATNYGELMGENCEIIGIAAIFEIDDFIVQVDRLNTGETVQVFGQIGDHTFIAYQGALNFCHGPQAVNYSLNIHQ